MARRVEVIRRFLDYARRWFYPLLAAEVYDDVDGEYEGSVYVTGTGQVLRGVHDPEQCYGRPCVIHAPSDHSMRDFPTHFRFDRYLMERICPHGVGHPDPDDVAFQEREMPGREPDVHGCDGCCS